MLKNTNVILYLLPIVKHMITRDGWLVGWFYGVSIFFESFNAELNFKQFSLV